MMHIKTWTSINLCIMETCLLQLEIFHLYRTQTSYSSKHTHPIWWSVHADKFPNTLSDLSAPPPADCWNIVQATKSKTSLCVCLKLTFNCKWHITFYFLRITFFFIDFNPVHADAMINVCFSKMAHYCFLDWADDGSNSCINKNTKNNT